MFPPLRFLLASVAILVCASCSGFRTVKTGKAAISHFHEQFNAGLSDDIYRDASQEYQGSATAELHRKIIEGVREKMGSAGQFEVTNWRVDFLTGGRLVALQCKTTFANGEATESFQWRIEGTKAMLLGWHINSPLLIYQLSSR
jgi:hypothetical protein